MTYLILIIPNSNKCYVRYIIYPTDFPLNKSNSFDTGAPFLDLYLSIMNSIVSSKIYDNGMILILK